MSFSRKAWFLNIGIWTSIVVFQSVQSYTSSRSEGSVAHLGPVIVLQCATWFSWALLSPVLFKLSQEHPLENLFSFRSMVLYPLIGIASIGLQVATHTVAMILYPDTGWSHGPFGAIYLSMLRWMVLPSLLVFVGIIGAGHAITYYRKFQDRELRTSQLEQQLTEARLHSLQMQLQPHFFFNTLHAIASLVRVKQNSTAVKMIARFSDLMRYTLDQADKPKTPLSQEMKFVREYLDIEQTRFADRMKVNVHINREVLKAFIPSLLLQPVVENAIKHGIARLPRKGSIDIVAHRINGDLCIEVTNDGVGYKFNGSDKSGNGVGLKNVQQRLHQLYGDRHSFAIEEGRNGRVTVSLVIPYEESLESTS